MTTTKSSEGSGQSALTPSMTTPPMSCNPNCTYKFQPTFNMALMRSFEKSGTLTTSPAYGPNYLVYASYTISSHYSATSSCFEAERVLYLSSPYSFTISDDNPTSEALHGQSAFSKFLGGTCILPSGAAVPTPLPMGYSDNSATPPAVSNSNDTATATTVPASEGRPVWSNRLLAAIIIPSVFALVAFLFFIFRWRIHRASRKRIASGIDNASTQEQRSNQVPPFLQLKAELAGQASRFEIDGREKRLELTGETRPELNISVPSNADSVILLDCLNAQRLGQTELAGEEIAKEKEGDTVER